MTGQQRRITTQTLLRMKQRRERISMLTAYDFTMASILDTAGVDILLVGDSLGMVVQGEETTIPVSLRDMIYHGRLVARAAKRAMVVVDLPFPHGQLGVRKTLAVSARIMKQTGCQAVKLEGGAEQAATIRALAGAGIAVIAHVGLRPQSVHRLGGYHVQRNTEQILEDATAAEAAGAFCVLMECVPTELAAQVTAALKVPTIGIGAGPECDGQVLVTHDLIGLTVGRVPKFVRQKLDLSKEIQQAVQEFNAEVRAGTFPSLDESFE